MNYIDHGEITLDFLNSNDTGLNITEELFEIVKALPEYVYEWELVEFPKDEMMVVQPSVGVSTASICNHVARCVEIPEHLEDDLETGIERWLMWEHKRIVDKAEHRALLGD